jgi:hypothetical protein
MSTAPEMPAAPAPPPRGEAFYFDGITSKRHDVIVEAAASALRIIDDSQSHVVDAWNYADLRARSSPEGVMRLGRRGEVALARLEVRDAALAAAIDERAPALDRGGAADRRLRQRVVVLSLAAIASVVLTAVFGMPVLANKITPIIPLRIEKKFGEAIDRQVRTMLDAERSSEAFLCGAGAGEAPGRKALDKVVQDLEQTAHAPYHFHVEVVRQPVTNAFALPGGHIYVYDGLLKKSETAHELDGAGERRPVVSVRHDARRFCRRRRRRHRGEDDPELVLFPPRRSRRRPLQRRTDAEGRRRPESAWCHSVAHRRRQGRGI